MHSLNTAVSLNRLLMIITSSGREHLTGFSLKKDLVLKRIKVIVFGDLFLFQVNWKCAKTVLKQIRL